MVVCLVRLIPSTVCFISHGLLYMVMSKGLHVTDVDVFHTCNWTVCCMYWTGVSGVGSTGVVGANVTISFYQWPP